MYKNKKIAVIIPAYNEEILIEKTVSTLPEYIDYIVVVDDKSQDSTPEILKELSQKNSKVIALFHEKNKGCGAARTTAYRWCVESDVDIAVGIDGDGQMDPDEIQDMIDPIADDKADYTKGNRLVTGEAWKKIPKIRYLGNSVLTLMTKIASGYWHVTDSQSGFNAINRKALELIPFEDIYARYGWPNHILVMLNIYKLRVKDVTVKPIYGIGEKSGLKINKIIFTMGFLVIRLFFYRMIQIYIIRDFHPLIFFYVMGIFLLFADIPLLVRLILVTYHTGLIPSINALTIVFCTILGLQSILFAMLFDMEANRELKGDK